MMAIGSAINERLGYFCSRDVPGVGSLWVVKRPAIETTIADGGRYSDSRA